MYVRSQNKKFLGNVDSFVVCGASNDQIWANDEQCLGVYNSEDRALEVLDMITDHLEDGCTLAENSGGQLFTRECIFEMPLRWFFLTAKYAKYVIDYDLYTLSTN